MLHSRALKTLLESRIEIRTYSSLYRSFKFSPVRLNGFCTFPLYVAFLLEFQILFRFFFQLVTIACGNCVITSLSMTFPSLAL